MKNIAPEIIRKRLPLEAKYTISVSDEVVRNFLLELPKALNLRAYWNPAIHSPQGEGKWENQGCDGFIPLIDSGIYIGIWANKKFLSCVFYTCKDFPTKEAVGFIK